MNAALPQAVTQHMALEDLALTLLLKAIRYEAKGVHSFELVDPDGQDLPAFEAGAHVDVQLPGGLVRSYSLAGNPQDRSRYVLGVLREAKGRGGSAAMHDRLKVGQALTISAVRNAFALAPQAAHTILLGGGIGITPLKAMAHTLAASGQSFELHYCVRSMQHAAFVPELQALVPQGRLHIHCDNGDPVQGLNIQALLQTQPAQTHVYFCGPSGFMQACEAATAHWENGTVHSEHFKAPEPPASQLPDGGFEVHLVRSGVTIAVQPDQTIVRAIELTGRRVPTSCLSGLCGACKVNYTEGEVDHRDYILSDSERDTCLTVCVSRAKSKTLSLDL